jgi:hypothetical protein
MWLSSMTLERRGRLAVVGELGVDAALRVGAALVRVMNEKCG